MQPVFSRSLVDTRTTVAWIGLAALIVAIPIGVTAATSLRGTMHAWKGGARATHNVLSGQAAFDERANRNALQAYIDDAGRIQAQVNNQTAAARDFKQRFVAFRADAQAALDNLGCPPALKVDSSRIMSDCQSCHDSFN